MIIKPLYLLAFFLSSISPGIVQFQKVPASTSGITRFSCSEKERKNPESDDPIIIKTCFLNDFKFVSIGRPDYAGRYSYEYSVYRNSKKGYIKSKNSEVFNTKQTELLAIINQRIQKEFKENSTDPHTKDCFDSIKSVSNNKMDDLNISFYGKDIWFSCEFGLPGYCRNVDGSIVIFKLSEISQYLK